MDWDFFIFDDSLVDEIIQTRENFKEIVDYFTCINSVGTITKMCLDKIEISNLPEGAKKVIRGIMSDEREINTNHSTLDSTITLCNSESKLKSVLLITSKNYPFSSFKGSVKIMSFLTFSQILKENQDFNLWKATEIMKIQKVTAKISLPNMDFPRTDPQVDD